LLVLGASAQLLDTVLDTYQYSNYKALSSKSMLLLLWTPSETSIDFAVVGRMNFAGNEHCQKDGCWMGTGWNPTGSSGNVMIGSRVVMGRYHPNGTEMIEERSISGRDVSQVALTTSQFSESSINFDGDYMIVQFTRSRSATPALTFNTTIWSCMSMRVDLFDLARHGPYYASTEINFDTGAGATPFTRCSSENCINGDCSDSLQCTCNEGWSGNKCDTSTSTPTAPTSTPLNAPTSTPTGKTSGSNPLSVILTCSYVGLGAGLLYFM
jgi:hypothetical protein